MESGYALNIALFLLAGSMITVALIKLMKRRRDGS